MESQYQMTEDAISDAITALNECSFFVSTGAAKA